MGSTNCTNPYFLVSEMKHSFSLPHLEQYLLRASVVVDGEKPATNKVPGLKSGRFVPIVWPCGVNASPGPLVVGRGPGPGGGGGTTCETHSQLNNFLDLFSSRPLQTQVPTIMRRGTCRHCSIFCTRLRAPWRLRARINSLKHTCMPIGPISNPPTPTPPIGMPCPPIPPIPIPCSRVQNAPHDHEPIAREFFYHILLWNAEIQHQQKTDS